MVLYISLNIDEKSKRKLSDFIERNLDKRDYCFLERKGGNVVSKAHLTLNFGFAESEYEKIKNDPRINELVGRSLNIEKLEVFNLGKAKCKVLVLRVFNESLSELREYFFQHYKLDDSGKYKKYNSYKPHISLAYIKKDTEFDLNKLNKEIQKIDSLKIDKVEVKFFKIN